MDFVPDAGYWAALPRTTWLFAHTPVLADTEPALTPAQVTTALAEALIGQPLSVTIKNAAGKWAQLQGTLQAKSVAADGTVNGFTLSVFNPAIQSWIMYVGLGGLDKAVGSIFLAMPTPFNIIVGAFPNQPVPEALRPEHTRVGRPETGAAPAPGADPVRAGDRRGREEWADVLGGRVLPPNPNEFTVHNPYYDLLAGVPPPSSTSTAPTDSAAQMLRLFELPEEDIKSVSLLFAVIPLPRGDGQPPARVLRLKDIDAQGDDTAVLKNVALRQCCIAPLWLHSGNTVFYFEHLGQKMADSFHDAVKKEEAKAAWRSIAALIDVARAAVIDVAQDPATGVFFEGIAHNPGNETLMRKFVKHVLAQHKILGRLQATMMNAGAEYAINTKTNETPLTASVAATVTRSAQQATYNGRFKGEQRRGDNNNNNRDNKKNHR